jgi:hypothetical protein
MFGHSTRDGWGDTNPEDDAGYFVVNAAELRGLRLSRMGMGDVGA